MREKTLPRSVNGFETHTERIKTMKDVYAIYESENDGKDRARWVRVGVAFPNRDGSLIVLLDALPLSGRLQIRDRSEPQTGKEEAQ
jgi:hypothetical protein